MQADAEQAFRCPPPEESEAFSRSGSNASLIASTHLRRTPAASGLLYGLSAYLLWGLFPLFWPLLEPATPLEILSCRIVFCFVVIAVLLAVRNELRGLRQLDRGTVLRLCAAGIAIAVNWGVYIWGVNNGHVIETSLGYFITPLVTIGLGVLAVAGDATFVGHAANAGHLILLVSAGPVTALPLLFFAAAATRLPLSTMGLLQYVTPVMQFAIGVLILRETTSIALLSGFALVWIALAMLGFDGLRQRHHAPAVVAA